MDGQMNLFKSVQELAGELFKDQKKITIKRRELIFRKVRIDSSTEYTLGGSVKQTE